MYERIQREILCFHSDYEKLGSSVVDSIVLKKIPIELLRDAFSDVVVHDDVDMSLPYSINKNHADFLKQYISDENFEFDFEKFIYDLVCYSL